MPTLPELQRAFYQLVTAPEDVARTLAGADRGAAEVEALFHGDARLSAIDRLDVYGTMYFARIHDVLRGMYPAVASAIGHAHFHNLVTDYLLACRPAHANLGRVGDRLPAWLRGDGDRMASWPWLADLAALEAARTLVFDAADAEPLTLDHLRATPADDVAALRLGLVPAAVVVDAGWEVAGAWEAAQARGEGGEDHDHHGHDHDDHDHDGHDHDDHDHDDHEPHHDDDHDVTAPPEGAQSILVWRCRNVVVHRVLAPDEAVAIHAIQAGAPFGGVCEAIAGVIGDDDAVMRASMLLASWCADDVLAAGA